MQYSISQGLAVSGFELGNELNLGNQYPPTTVGKDFSTLHGIMSSLYPTNRPLLIGPDETPDATFLATFLNSTHEFLDVVTWHLYIGYGLDSSILSHPIKIDLNIDLTQQLLDPVFLDRIRSFSLPIVETKRAFAPNAQLWVGESAAAYHSGSQKSEKS